MLLNENEENKKISNKSNNKNRTKTEKSINYKILNIKRMRDMEESINYYDIIALNNNNNHNDIKINEEMDFSNMSTSGKTLSVSKNGNGCNNHFENNNTEEKIMQLKIALQDQPYKSYFQLQNYD